MSLVTSLIQTIFFKDLKSTPKPGLLRRAKALGKYTDHRIIRRNKNIASYLIEPVDASAEPGVVIFSHPISRKGKFFFSDSERAQAYLKHGYAVLAFDYNGFGESDVIDLFYWKDVVQVIEFVKEKFPNQKIVLHGTSFGAFHIIRALGHLPLNAQVVLENVNKSLLSYWRKWPSTGLFVRLLEWLRLRAIRDMDVQTVVREFNRKDLHIQFIACEHDEMTTLAEMRELFELLSTDNKSFAIFKNVGHLAAPKDAVLYQSVLFNRGCHSC